MHTSDKLDAIAKALSKFQGEIDSVKQDQDNPFFKSKYSNLNSIWSAIRPHLASNGLSIIQEAVNHESGVSVSTRIQHDSGQFFQLEALTIPLGKRDAHSVGSATSYAKRYAICAALGIVSGNEDDDGNRATQSAPKEPPRKVIKEFTQAQMDDWIARQAEKYPLQDLEDFCQAHADHFKNTIQLSVATLADNEALFVKNFEAWVKKQAKGE
jgi:hypothetical protein